MEDLWFEYEPYRGHDGEDIPCFRIYANCEVIAETNEHHPESVQNDFARLFAASGEMLKELERAIQALALLPEFRTNEGITSHKLIADLKQMVRYVKGT